MVFKSIHPVSLSHGTTIVTVPGTWLVVRSNLRLNHCHMAQKSLQFLVRNPLFQPPARIQIEHALEYTHDSSTPAQLTIALQPEHDKHTGGTAFVFMFPAANRAHIVLQNAALCVVCMCTCDRINDRPNAVCVNHVCLYKSVGLGRRSRARSMTHVIRSEQKLKQALWK